MQGGPALSCRRYVRPSLALIPALSHSDKSRNPFATELRGSQRYRSPYIDKCKCRGKPSTMIGESSAWMSGWM